MCVVLTALVPLKIEVCLTTVFIISPRFNVSAQHVTLHTFERAGNKSIILGPGQDPAPEIAHTDADLVLETATDVEDLADTNTRVLSYVCCKLQTWKGVTISRLAMKHTLF